MSSVEGLSSAKDTYKYNEKIKRAASWLDENPSIGDELSFHDMEKIFDESMEVVVFLYHFKLFYDEPTDQISRKILEKIQKIDIGPVLTELKESRSKASLKGIFEQLEKKIYEFYTLTLEAQNLTPKEQRIKGEWKSKIENLGL